MTDNDWRGQMSYALALCLLPGLVLGVLYALDIRRDIASQQRALSAIPHVRPVLELAGPLAFHDMPIVLAKVRGVDAEALERDELFDTSRLSRALTGAIRAENPEGSGALEAAQALIERLGETSGLNDDRELETANAARLATRHVPEALAQLADMAAALKRAEAVRVDPTAQRRAEALALARWQAGHRRLIAATNRDLPAALSLAVERFASDSGPALDAVAALDLAAARDQARRLHRQYVAGLTDLGLAALDTTAIQLTRRIKATERRGFGVLAGVILSAGLGLALAAGLFFSGRSPTAEQAA